MLQPANGEATMCVVYPLPASDWDKLSVGMRGGERLLFKWRLHENRYTALSPRSKAMGVHITLPGEIQ